MPQEPSEKRVIAFVDGQNLFYAAKKAFGYSYPNYDPHALAQKISISKNWKLIATHFYTGVPTIEDNPAWHSFWSAKLVSMGKMGIKTFRRALRYRHKTSVLSDGKEDPVLVGQEKGIDIRIALDIVRLAHRNLYDIAMIFSQDQDLSEAVDEVKTISAEQDRWIKVVCPFPKSPTYENKRGINGTEWIKIDRKTYDQCLDPNDYRPKLKEEKI